MSYLHTISTKNLVQTIHDMICEPYVDSLCQFEVILVFCGPCVLVRPSVGAIHMLLQIYMTSGQLVCGHGIVTFAIGQLLCFGWPPFLRNKKGVPIPVTEKRW